MYLTATLFQRTLSPRASPFGNITMNVSHLLVLICFTRLLISSLCSDTQDSVVEGSGEVLTHTDKVPVIEDELVTTRASTHKDLLPSHVQNPKSNDKATTTTTPTTTPPRDSGYDVVIMMDSSIPRKTFDSMKKYTKTLINKFSIDDKEYKVGLMRYGESNDKQWDLNDYSRKRDVLSAVDRVGYKQGKSSDAASAIRMVRRRMFNDRNGDRDFARNLIVLMTANERSDDIYATWNEAEEAEKENINLYTVGFDLNDTTEIDETSTHPLYIYSHLINTDGGDDVIDYSSTDNILGFIDEDVEPPRPRPKPTTTTTTTMPTTAINQCFAQVDLIFVLDSSTSVGNDNYDKMKDFVKKFLHSANIDGGEVRVGLVSYSTKVTVEFQLNSYLTKADVFAAVDTIPWRYGSTNTADGLQTMHEEMFTEGNGDRPGVPNICIIMTDGVSNINYRRTIPEAKKAREKDIHIYAIGIALKDLKEVNGIASEPASLNVFAVKSFDELEGLDEKIFESSCSGPTTAVPLPKSGYDVVLVFDSSGTPQTYQVMKDYAKNLVDGFSVEDQEYRVGLMRYSTDADVQFDLDEYSTKDDIKNAIDKSLYNPGETDTAKAINSVRENMFRETHGDRDFARNLIVLLTGQDQSKDTYDSWAAAEKAEAAGINLFTVGINLDDTREINELSTHPLQKYRHLINTNLSPAEINRTANDILGLIDDDVEPERPRPKPTTRVELEPVDSCAINNGGCAHSCRHGDGGPVCSCRKGYILQIDKKSCVAFTTDSERTTSENTVTPITNTQDGTLFTTTEPDTQSEASFSTTEPGTDSEASFSTTKPDTDTEASFSTIEPGTDSEASFSTTEPGTDSETSFSTTQPGTGTESSLDTTEPDVFYTTTETDNDTLFTTNAPDGDNATLFTTETNTESENTENNQTGMFSTVTQPGMVYNGSSTDAELESNATDPNFPENGESTTNNAGFTRVTETSSTFMENTSTNDMNTISSTSVVMENNTAQITATEDFSNSSQAPVTTNSFSTLTDLRFTEEATQTAVASTTQQSAPATEATSVGASDILTSSPFSSIVTSPHTITTVISNISTGPSQEVSGGVSSTSTSSTTVSGSVSTTLSSTTRTTTDSGSVSTTTVSGSVSTTLSSTTRASGSPGASSTIGVGSTVTSSIEQQSRSSALDCNTYLLVVALLLLKNFTVYILNIGVLTG